MAERVCLKHRMPDGTIMDGPVHGAGQHCVEYGTGVYKKGGKIKNSKYTGNGRKSAKHYSAGGMLVGPSHDNGGIPALVDGTEPIEVEGGEFIINKQTVDAVGEDFLHKLNSTQTTHHSGGYGQGELPSPSNYKSGGKLIGENKMRNRRTKPVRKMGGGGRACGPGTVEPVWVVDIVGVVEQNQFLEELLVV